MHLKQSWQHLAWKTMKISITQLALILFCGSLGWSNPGSAQDLLSRTVSIQAKDEKLRQVLSAIERQADVRFVYSPQTVGANSRVTLIQERQKLSDVLTKLFGRTSIQWEIVGGQIILKRTPAKTKTGSLLEAGTESELILPAADRKLTGRVIDGATQEPLPGVSILVKGTQQGTVSDVNGRYELTVPDRGEITLVFSFVGYAPVEVAAGNRNSIDISMAVDEKALEEVVVVGYGTQKVATVTGSITSVKGEVLDRAPAINLSNSMAGRLPGWLP